jgi:drug/metabolite transporter (DMT)-like permease
VNAPETAAPEPAAPARWQTGGAWLAVVAIWTTTPLGIQWSTWGASYSFAVLIRMGLALVACALLLALLRVPLPTTPTARRLYAVSGGSIFVSMILTYWAAQHIPSGLISVIYGVLPLATGVLAAFWLHQHVFNPLRVAGLAGALAGLWVLFGQPWAGDGLAAWGIVATFVGMAVQAAGLVWIKRLDARVHPVATTTGALAFGLPLFLLAWLVADAATVPDISARAAWATLYLALAGSVAGFSLYYFVIRHVDTMRVALMTLVTPVTALLLGQAINDEVIPPAGWLGVALVGAGLVAYEWTNLRQLVR